jgi:hypothetical protein
MASSGHAKLKTPCALCGRRLEKAMFFISSDTIGHTTLTVLRDYAIQRPLPVKSDIHDRL